MEVSELLLAEGKVTVDGGTCRVERDDYENLAIPNTIRSVFVSRIDQLSSSEQITLKVASVIGPIFSLTLVCDIYPSGASKLQIADDMASLLRDKLVQSITDSSRSSLSIRQSLSYKRDSMEAARKSMDNLLHMKFMRVFFLSSSPAFSA